MMQMHCLGMVHLHQGFSPGGQNALSGAIEYRDGGGQRVDRGIFRDLESVFR